MNRWAHVVLLALSVMYSAVAIGVEDDVDREIGRAAAATAVAESLMSDAAYDATLLGFLGSAELDEYLSTDQVKKAIKADEGKVKEAALAAAKELIPRAAYTAATAHAIAEKFTYTELKQILTFIRSDVGKRYAALAFDQAFMESLAANMYNGKETPDPRPVLERELKARFPSMQFKF